MQARDEPSEGVVVCTMLSLLLVTALVAVVCDLIAMIGA